MKIVDHYRGFLLIEENQIVQKNDWFLLEGEAFRHINKLTDVFCRNPVDKIVACTRNIAYRFSVSFPNIPKEYLEEMKKLYKGFVTFEEEYPEYSEEMNLIERISDEYTIGFKNEEPFFKNDVRRNFIRDEYFDSTAFFPITVEETESVFRKFKEEGIEWFYIETPYSESDKYCFKGVKLTIE